MPRTCNGRKRKAGSTPMSNNMEKATPDLQDIGPDTAETFLLSFGSENPAALALLGIHYLKKWKSSGEIQYLEQGREALKEAASQGEPEANWQLYSYVIQEGTREGISYVPPKYLLEKESEREEHLMRAARAGHRDALDEYWRGADDQTLWDETNSEQRKEQFKGNLADINNLRPLAQQGDKQAQLDLARSLIESYWDLVCGHVPAEYAQHGEQFAKNWQQEAKEMLESAAAEYPEARYLLAVSKRFVKDEGAAIDLLRDAGFPKHGEEPYPLALVALATRLTDRREYADAEKCLREAISQGVGAETKLANLIYEHREEISGDLAEALRLYEQLADRVKDPLAAFRAGQMHLRGEACPQDLNKAKHFFEIGAQSGQETHDFGEPELRAGLPLDWFDDHVAPPLYCKLALVLGWPKESGVIVSPMLEGTHILLDRLAQRHCQAEMYDFLQYRDVICLLKHWNRYQPLLEAVGQEELEILLSPLLGLIRILSEKSIKDTDSNRYFDLNESVLEIEKKLALGWLLSSGRLGVVDLEKADHHFHTVKRSLPDIKKSYVGREDVLSGRETSVQRISRLTQKGLRYCEEQRSEKAQADKERAVQLAREEERRQMISFLSHTLVSVTTGSSNLLREIVSELSSGNDHETNLSLAARLASTAVRASITESLVKVFKLYTSNPEALREGWIHDQGGDYSVTQTIVLALQMTILRFCRMPDFKKARKNLLPQADYDLIIKEFITEIMPLDGRTFSHAEKIHAWLERRLPFLHLSLDGIEQIRIVEDGTRHIVIFALAIEFLTNAFKYVAPGGEIIFSVSHSDDNLILGCANPVDKDIALQPLSGKTGLDFIREICKLIGAELDGPTITSNNYFSLQAILPLG